MFFFLIVLNINVFGKMVSNWFRVIHIHAKREQYLLITVVRVM